MIDSHHIRRIGLVVLLIIMMGSTSCRTNRVTAKRVILPPEIRCSQEIALLETEELANSLSLDLSMKIEVEEDNLLLYSFIDDWKGTRYRFGGTSKRGTDCSGFVYRLFENVYGIDVGRQSSADLMSMTSRVSKDEIKEGDMVFFNINNRRGGRASHVGVYLKDNKFVHATTRNGVIISSLNEPYYKRTYIGAGRVIK